MRRRPLDGSPKTHDRTIEVVILWGDSSVLHATHLRPDQRFVLGDPDAVASERVDFAIGEATLGRARFTLIDVRDGAPLVRIPRGAQAELERDGQIHALGEQANPTQAPALRPHDTHELTLEAGDRVSLSYQGFHFVVRELAADAIAGLGTTGHFDLREHAWSLGSLAFHTLFLALFQFLPSAAASLQLDEQSTQSRLVRTFLEAQALPEPELPPSLEPAGGDAPGERAMDAEGKAGSPKDKPSRRKATSQGAPSGEAEAQEGLRALASTMGINGVLLSLRGPSANLFTASNAASERGENILGAIHGDMVGANFGFNGAGATNNGRGGGGDAVGTVGLDRIQTRGGVGVGGIGPGIEGKFGGHVGRVPRVRTRPPEVVGALSREVIRREIGRHLAEVRFCYEQGLRTRPELSGRVTVKFLIAPSGAVMQSAVQQNELGAPGVALCIAEAVRRWNFPAPDGSGVVKVSYPFVLQQTR